MKTQANPVRVWRSRLRKVGALVDAQEYWDFLALLTKECLPEPKYAISRDLMLSLAYYHGKEVGAQGQTDGTKALREICAQAWLGFTKPHDLCEVIIARHGSSIDATRTVRFVRELERKQSTYMFLPIVGAVIRRDFKIDSALLREVEQRLTAAATTSGGIGLVPRLVSATAACDLINVTASCLDAAGARPSGSLHDTAAELRNAFESSGSAPFLPQPSSENHPRDSDHLRQSINRTCPWLWIDALVLVNNLMAGPQSIEYCCRPEVMKA